MQSLDGTWGFAFYVGFHEARLRLILLSKEALRNCQKLATDLLKGFRVRKIGFGIECLDFQSLGTWESRALRTSASGCVGG